MRLKIDSITHFRYSHRQFNFLQLFYSIMQLLYYVVLSTLAQYNLYHYSLSQEREDLVEKILSLEDNFIQDQKEKERTISLESSSLMRYRRRLVLIVRNFTILTLRKEGKLLANFRPKTAVFDVLQPQWISLCATNIFFFPE